MKRSAFRLFASVVAVLMLLCLCGCEMEVSVSTLPQEGVTTTTVNVTAGDTDPWDGATKPATTTVAVATTTTTRTTTTAITTQKVYGTTMYVDWDPSTQILQVVQKYSDTQDFVSVIKPIAPNGLLQFVSPKVIADTHETISHDLSSAQTLYGMPESDWLGPHMINGDWHGGSHGSGGSSTPTAYADDVVLLIDGKETSGTVGTYAGEVTLTYTNNIWHASTKVVFMKEFYTLTFDGEKWSVNCTIRFLESASSWSSYYGMQCTYGAWMESIAYGSDAPQSLADANGNTKASSWNCDTMVLRSASGDALEMKLDRTFGLGRGTLIDRETSAGAFTSAYPHPNGKAYFLLVNSGQNPSAGAEFKWRGTYRFFAE